MKTKLQKHLETYFAIGNIVPSYGRKYDKVLRFDWNNGSWYVQVQHCTKDGSQDITDLRIRTHATRPTNRELGITK